MAPSIIRLGAVALACASSVIAQEAYTLKESYDTTNFFQKFNFFNEKDPNNGHVRYVNKADAEKYKLIRTDKDDVYIGVDATSGYEEGRRSVRLESRNTYNKGLIIADFSHLPAKACGAWPAFWMVGPTWPTDGEIDIVEGWNLNERNKIVLHTDDPKRTGVCTIDKSTFTSDLKYANCFDPVYNTGCAVEETNGLWGNPSGGVCK